MRYTITGIHENFVLLENELKFIEHYLTLQKVRLPQKDSIRIDIEIQFPTTVIQIAPLVLLPFVENVFKYGISIDEPCFVHIKIIPGILNKYLILKPKMLNLFGYGHCRPAIVSLVNIVDIG